LRKQELEVAKARKDNRIGSRGCRTSRL